MSNEQSSSRPCRRCGYDLRGVAVDGICPECGTPASLADVGDELWHADPRWLQHIARGARRMQTGFGILIASLILIVAYNRLPASLAAALLALAHVAGLSVLMQGVWQITKPEPAAAEHDGKARWIRAASVALLVLVACDWLRQALPLPTVVVNGLNVVVLAGLLIAALGLLAYLRFVQQMAERVPYPQLQQQAGYLWIASLVWCIGSGVGYLGFTIAGPAGTGLLGFLSAVPLVAMTGFVLFLAYTALQDMLCKSLEHEGGRAQKAWAAAGGE